MTRVHLEAHLTARRRMAQHELDRWLGGPTREHHVRADQALGAIDEVSFWLGELERWEASA